MSETKCSTSQWVVAACSRVACGKNAKVEYGGLPYCGIHDPVRRAREKAGRIYDARCRAIGEKCIEAVCDGSIGPSSIGNMVIAWVVESEPKGATKP